MFRPIPYIEWFVEREGQATHDLARSDLRPPTPGADGGSQTVGDGHEELVPPRLAAQPSPGPGDPTAEELLAERYDVTTENVALTAGTSHANALVAATVLDHPDEVAEGDRSRVLVETPGYQPHHLTPASLGADVWRFRRDDGELDPDRVDAAIDDTVDLVTLSNRHNPTGRLASRETLAAVARSCGDHGAVLHVDEVYAPFTVGDETGPYDGPGDGPFGGVTAARLPNTVVTNSLTKFFGFGGLRFGWAVGDAALIADLGRTARHVPDLAEPSRVLGRRALANADALAEDCHDVLAANHALLDSFVAERADLAGEVPAGSTFAALGDGTADGAGDGRNAGDCDDSGDSGDTGDTGDGDPGAPGDADNGGDPGDGGEPDGGAAGGQRSAGEAADGVAPSDDRDWGDVVADAAWERDVFVVPGRFFGMPDRVRIALGGHPDAMADALAAFGRVLDEL